MKHLAYGLLCAMALATASAQDAVLPQDFFISSFGTLNGTTEIKALSNNTFEFGQHFRKGTTEGEQLNFMTFCMASAIAAQRKSNGWSLGMLSSNDPGATSRTMTLVLLNNEADAKNMPKTNHWLPYQTPGQFRQTCSHFVDAKYLWSESASADIKKAPISYDVAKGEPAYPDINPQPNHQLTMSGNLPSSEPIDDIEVLYTTDAQPEVTCAEHCRRPSEYPDKIPPFPLTHRVL